MLIRNKTLKILTRTLSQYKDTAWSKKKHVINRAHIKRYEALPDFLRVEPKDPFDYPLRNKEQVQKDLEIQPRIICTEVTQVFFLENKKESKRRSAVVSFIVDMKDQKLTQKQRERMLFLVGNQRYNKKKDQWRMTITHYPERHQNLSKGREMLQEIYLESLRAP